MEQKTYRYLEQLKRIAGNENVAVEEPLKRHTSFRIGGPADYFVTPQEEEALRGVTDYCRQEGLPYYVIGNGSNLLADDEGYRGVIIQLWKNYAGIRVSEDMITAQAGCLLSSLAARACRESLTGLEFASGIPGTLGGGTVMNAGAYGGELKDVITSVRVMTQEGEFLEFSAEQMQFGYRTSVVPRKGYIVLEGSLRLKKGDPEQIAAVMEELRQKRNAKQPLDLPSAGSTFKRPEGYFAGKLIMDAGLAGFRVGGAMVSPKHCGFVVNVGGATAEDVKSLIQQVQDRVLAQFGVMLEPEVKYLSGSGHDQA